MARNLAVVGLDAFNRKYLTETLRDAGDIRFHAALERDDTMIHGPKFDFEERLQQAQSNMEAIEGGVDGVLTYWDFPSTSLAPLLAQAFDLPYASPQAVLKCEHKLWSRMEQAEIIETPAFCGFSPFDDDPLAAVTIDFPFWVKPVVGHSSMLGFEIGDEETFAAALEEIRAHIRELTRPFRYFCEAGGVPGELADQGITLCLAEEMISDGDQYTLEGYVQNGAMTIHGVIESHRTSNEHSFSRYQYPSSLEDTVAARMEAICQRVLTCFDYDNCAFNIEFFYSPETDSIRLLEINPRISQSHSDMFLKVDGQPNQQIPVDLALGRDPRWKRGEGEFAVAAKFFLRHGENARVVRAPTRDDLSMLRSKLPDVRLDMHVEPGMELEDLDEQETYSFDLADLFIGGKDEAELLEKFAICCELLDFELKPPKRQTN